MEQVVLIPGAGASKWAVEKSANEATSLPALFASEENGSDGFLAALVIAWDGDGVGFDKGCGCGGGCA